MPPKELLEEVPVKFDWDSAYVTRWANYWAIRDKHHHFLHHDGNFAKSIVAKGVVMGLYSNKSSADETLNHYKPALKFHDLQVGELFLLVHPGPKTEGKVLKKVSMGSGYYGILMGDEVVAYESAVSGRMVYDVTRFKE